MHKLEIIRQNGNVPKSLVGEDHVTGFLVYAPVEEIPEAFAEEHVQAVSTIDRAEALGITAESECWTIRALHYHLSEVFRVNPAVSLYLGIFVRPVGTMYSFAEIKTIQNYAGGRIRQMAIWEAVKVLADADVTAIQGVVDTLDAENAPLSVIYAPAIRSVDVVSINIATNCPRVSVLIGQDGDGIAKELFEEKRYAVTCIGTVIGLLSRAQVHQSISWVKEFPTGIAQPGFSDGSLLRNWDKAIIEQLDTARYMFLTTYPGVAGCYVNDSHTMDAATSDYAMIESVRTMDKAVRGVRTYLTPELGGNLYIDASTGKMQAFSVAHLETTANKALEDMEKAGELSGYKVEIDAEQDVLSTSTVEIVIKQVAVGVMRKIKVKIGFAKSV